MQNSPTTALPFIPSFARRIGRALQGAAKRRVAELLPELAISLDEIPALTDWIRKYSSCQMEIGFGGGEHLAALARAQPDIAFIGCEPFINGVAKLLAEIEAHNLHNIRIFTDDARLLCQALSDDTGLQTAIHVIHVLFPDPWPKTRHHKRRLIQQESLSLFASIQPIGGTLQLATDDPDYAAWMLEALLLHPQYHWQAESQADWLTPPEHWTPTRYEHKTRAMGRVPMFFRASCYHSACNLSDK